MLRPLAWFLVAVLATVLLDQAVKEGASRRLAKSEPAGLHHYLVVETSPDTWEPTRTALDEEFAFSSDAEIDHIARHHTRILGGRIPDPDELLPPGTHLQVLNRDIVLIPGVLKLEYLENRRAAFGILTARAGIGVSGLALIGMAIFAACSLMLYFAPRDRAEFSIGLGLVGGGSVANAIDRTFRGYVIDYVSVVDFPTFNVADVAIAIGGALMLFQLAEWILWDRYGPHEVPEPP